MLRRLLEAKTGDRKRIVFIDELPWLDTRGSNLVSALEHFWNDWATTQHDLVLIVCGSATSWITNKILKNRGGLHIGRKTFIVNALSLGVPPNVVMKWTGHSDYKSMKPYIDIVDSVKADAMARFNGLL